MRLTTRAKHSVTLTLHTVDGLRQLPEAAGFTGVVREKYGAFERPRNRRFPSDVRALLRQIFPDASKRFRETRVHATLGTLWIDALCWRLRSPLAPVGEIPTPEGC